MTRPPKDLRTSGRKLWRSVVDVYVLDVHEEMQLLNLCRLQDRLDALYAAHPDDTPWSEADDKRAANVSLAIARLVAGLRLPMGTETSKHAAPRLPQRRVGTRGFYGPRAVVS